MAESIQGDSPGKANLVITSELAAVTTCVPIDPKLFQANRPHGNTGPHSILVLTAVSNSRTANKISQLACVIAGQMQQLALSSISNAPVDAIRTMLEVSKLLSATVSRSASLTPTIKTLSEQINSQLLASLHFIPNSTATLSHLHQRRP